eukprot:70182_1
MLSLLLLSCIAFVLSKPMPNKKRLGSSNIAVSYTNCTKSSAEATLQSVVFTPPPPEKTDSNWTATGNALVKEALTGGSWVLQASLGPIKVLNQNGDLCSPKTVHLPENGGTLIWEGVDCPTASSGIVPIKLTANVASSDPSVTVKISLTTQDQNGKDLICLEIQCKLS